MGWAPSGLRPEFENLGDQTRKISHLCHGRRPKKGSCVLFLLLLLRTSFRLALSEAFSVPFFVLVLFFKGPKEAAHMSARTHREQV